MDGDTLQQHARSRVGELPGAELEHPSGGTVQKHLVDPQTFGRREQ
ncbi:hypothetical protein QM716_14375 [Rhodococcus sp. IEGM 1409]|nr:hypothetical protein [Rhodococcus sp. IEGM 1409]MDI9901042.1 hypothetical protein [Rhodococcus sp. IEGM 1409]